jgi:hypothetical protein
MDITTCLIECMLSVGERGAGPVCDRRIFLGAYSREQMFINVPGWE